MKCGGSYRIDLGPIWVLFGSYRIDLGPIGIYERLKIFSRIFSRPVTRLKNFDPMGIQGVQG
jgi:hypothetical protein